MDSLEIMEKRCEGLRTRLDQLRADERQFQRAAGLREQQEKDFAAARDLERKRDEAKAALGKLRAKKVAAIQSTADALAKKMAAFLPNGRAVFSVNDDGGVDLGWDIPGHGFVPRAGLSGGQSVIFDAALAYALNRQDKANPVIIIEGAELGQEIAPMLEKIAGANVETQIIACTCHELAAVPAGWTQYNVCAAGAVQ